VTHKGGGIARGSVPLGGNIVATWPGKETETPTAMQLQCWQIIQSLRLHAAQNLAKCKFLLCLSLFTIRKPPSIMLMKKLSGIYLLPNGVWVRLHKDLLCYGPGYLILDIMDIAKLISLRSVAAVAAFDFVFVGKSASDEQREVGDINPGLGHQMESSRAL